MGLEVTPGGGRHSEITFGEGGQSEISADLPDPLKGLEDLIGQMLHLPPAEPHGGRWYEIEAGS